MGVIPVGYAQITHVYVGGAVPRGAVVTYGVEANWLDAQAAVADIHSSWGDTVVPNQNNSVTLSQTVAKLGPTETGPTFEFSQQIEGGDSGEPEPPNVAYLVSKKTALGGRKNRGRMYLPGCETVQIGPNGNLVSLFRIALENALIVHLDFLATNDSPMVILHSDETAPTPVTTLTVDNFCATQRRRLR